MDRDQEVKSWKCRRGHTMGLVVRHNRVRRLLLLREALEGRGRNGAAPMRMEEVDVMAVVEGYVADVRCSICGEVRTWVPGQEVIRRMLREARR
jgi:hypothetical protein